MKTAQLPYWRLSAVYFCYLGLLGVFVPYWNLYLRTYVHFSPAAIGGLLAVTSVVRVLAPGFLGRLADRPGWRLRVVRSSTLLLAVLWMAASSVKGWLPMACLLGIVAFFQNGILGPFEAVTQSHLATAGGHYGRIRLWGSLGFLVASAVAGSVLAIYSVKVLPWLLAAVAASTGVAAMLVPPSSPIAPSAAAPDFQRILRQPALRALLLCILLLQLAHAPYYTFYSLLLADHGYSAATTGVLWALGIGAEMAAFAVLHRPLARFGAERVLAAALLLSALRWWGLATATSLPVLALLQLLHAASFAACHVACMALLGRYFSAEYRGRAQGIYALLWNLGTAIGGGVAGLVWNSAGAVAIFGVAAALSLLAVKVILRQGSRTAVRQAQHGWAV